MKGFDISNKEFNFDEDLKFGEMGEDYARSFLRAITTGDYEVKTDRYRNGRMVIETNQNPRGMLDQNGQRIWVPSGINVTTSKWWIYIFSLDGAFLMLEVARLKRYLKFNKKVFNDATKISLGGLDNPARGFILYPKHVSDLLASSEYDLGG